MNILITTSFDFPHIGGLSTHVETLKAGLEEKGHKVNVISFTNVHPIIQLGYVRGPSFLLNRLVQGKGIVWSYERRKQLLEQNIKNFLATNRVDIINAQDGFATLASVNTGIPTVMTTHGYLTYEMISKGSVPKNSDAAKHLHKNEIRAYQIAGSVLTVDERIRQYIKKVADVDATAIKNFINVTDFAPNRNKRQEFRKKHHFSETDIVLFVPRRLTKKNGVIHPVKAVAKLVNEYPNIKLLYAGDGEERSSIEHLAIDLGVQNNVMLLGSISHSIIKEYYALSDIVLIPSIHSHGVEEATSISALEGMASGIPVIAGAVGGLKELITNKEQGLLVNAEDADEFSQAIRSIIKNPLFGQTLAENARKKIEKEHSHLTAASLFLKAYQNLLERRK